MDDEKRALYDQTGEIDDTLDINVQATYEYYRDIYPTITEKDITAFFDKYRNSEEEKEDLIDFYNDYKGDMTHILEFIPCSIDADASRFVSIFEELINSKVIKKFQKFTKTKNKIKKIHIDDEEEVNKEKEKLNELSKLIQGRQVQRYENLSNIKII